MSNTFCYILLLRESTQDIPTFQTFWGDRNISWGVDWDGVSDMLLYVEDVAGTPRIHEDIDDAIRRSIDNDPHPLGVMDFFEGLNKEMWGKIDVKTNNKNS